MKAPKPECADMAKSGAFWLHLQELVRVLCGLEIRAKEFWVKAIHKKGRG